ncbi:MAG: hypothetical protein ACRD98_07045 [Nitrososphaera sp.]
MARQRKTNPFPFNLFFDLDRTLKDSMKLMNKVINQFQEERTIPSKPPARKTQRT